MSLLLSESYVAVVKHVKHLLSDRAKMLGSRIHLVKAVGSDATCSYCSRLFEANEECLCFMVWQKEQKRKVIDRICLDRPTCLERERVRQEELAEKVTLPKTERETEKESFGV